MARPRPTDQIERRPANSLPIAGRVVERDEARRRLAHLKPDERTALLLRGAGFSYKEIGKARGWTYTKVNRSVSEGRAALGARKER